MSKFVSALAVCVLTVHAARFKRRRQAGAKEIGGIPVLNYHEGDSALMESAERTFIAMMDSGVSDAEMSKLCSAVGSKCVHGHSTGIPFVSMTASEKHLADVVRALNGAGIKYFEPSSTVYEIPEMEGEIQAATWGLNRVGAETRRATGSGTHIYILDTGVRVSHVDFGGRAKAGADALSGTAVACEGAGPECARDLRGHGTHCAGSAAGTNYGVAPGASVYGVKVLNDRGSGTLEGILAGMDWVAASGNKPTVASMSLGSGRIVQAYKGAIDDMFRAGVVVTVAAGNSNMDACGFSPAWVPNAITVGSTTSRDVRSGFSCFGKCVDIWAPGSSIVSASHQSDTGTTTKSGTSMACPHVAGAVAALFEEFPGLTAQQTMGKLKEAALLNRIADLTGDDANVFLWIGARSAKPPPLAEAPPTMAPVLPCPSWSAYSRPDRDGDCKCTTGKKCSVSGGSRWDCPCSGGPGAYGGRYFYPDCEDCACYPA